MVEVMIAALILTLGSLAVLDLVGVQAHNTYRAEESQVVSNRLQEEMEKIKDLPYSQIALSGLPADSSDTTDPRWRVSGTNFATSQSGSNSRALVYNGSSLVAGGTVSGGAVSPAPQSFSSGDVHGTIYRFVVWENDPSCPETACPGSQDLKRVIVAIRLDTTAVGGVRHYQELQSQISDPDAIAPCVSGATGCNPSDPAPVQPWLFFLTDTPCNNSTRQDITGDHKVHNTNGVCSAGMKTSDDCTVTLGVTSCPPGAPDLMFTSAPPLVGESPLYDYATDIEPPLNPDQDKGLQMPLPSSNGCLSSLFQPLTNVSGALIGDPDANRMQQIHKWVSPQMGTGFNVTITPGGTLNLWTQTVNNQTYTGRICIWLFERHLNLFGVPVDTPVVFPANPSNLTYLAYQPAGGIWPQTWTELHINLPFMANLTLGPNSRLGLAIQVEKQGTSGGGLQFMYDEPSFDSRLELKTSTSLLPF